MKGTVQGGTHKNTVQQDGGTLCVFYMVGFWALEVEALCVFGIWFVGSWVYYRAW